MDEKEEVRKYFRINELEKRLFRRFPKMSKKEKRRIQFLIELIFKQIFRSWQADNKAKQKGK